MMEPEIKEILLENDRRKRIIGAVFDPVSGEGSIGKRIIVEIRDFAHRKQWLPTAMLEEPLLKDILKAGDIKGYLLSKGKGMSHKEVSDRLIRLRCLHDFPFWAASFAYIKCKGGGDDVLFRLNRPQRKFVERLEEMRVRGKPIRLVLLKARQWGGSTCSQLYMAWLQLIHSRGLNSLIIAHQVVGSDEIKDMFDRMLKAYPLELLYEPGEDFSLKEKKLEGVGKSGAIYRVPQRNCKIKIGTAERPNSCRGGDYNLVHCSETGIWRATEGKTPEMICRSACSGILLKPLTMIVYESTANGTGNFFQREYEAAKRGESQFSPMFISWFDIDQYSLPLDDPEAFASRLFANRKVEASVSARCQPGAYLWWLWESGATLEAINWYVEERRKYNEHALMASEYPSDDVEAFVHSGAGVFDRYCVEQLKKSCRQPAFTGETEMCNDSRRIECGGVSFRQLESGGLAVWQLPPDNAADFRDRYLCVVDVGGRGLKSDWSVIAVFDRMPMASGEGPEVVAQWRGHVDFDILAEKAAMISAFYGNALLVIESNTIETRERERDTDGYQAPYLFTSLRDRYPNLYMRTRSDEYVFAGSPSRYGFHTNAATKPMVISNLVRMIREGLYVERDFGCIDEYLAYERRQNGSYGALAGFHDDILMTRAIGLHICFNEMSLPRHTEHRQPSRINRRRNPLTESSF